MEDLASLLNSPVHIPTSRLHSHVLGEPRPTASLIIKGRRSSEHRPLAIHSTSRYALELTHQIHSPGIEVSTAERAAIVAT